MVKFDHHTEVLSSSFAAVRHGYEWAQIMDSLDKIGDARSLAQIVVESVREPLLVLNEDLTILAASDSFLHAFKLTSAQVFHREFFTLDDGAWNLPELRQLLGRTFAEDAPIDGFDFTHDFARVGCRSYLLNVSKARSGERHSIIILLGFEDVTKRRAIEIEKENMQTQTALLLKKEHILLEEMQHRIVNSLQIVASILMMKARTIASVETRGHLYDAHRRVMSIAEVQKYLHSTIGADKIDMAPYLTKLCASLAGSMIGETGGAKLQVAAGPGKMISADAVSVGLIVTELVINALKYAFPDNKPSATVCVGYELHGSDWTLSVSDNGIGDTADARPPKGGLGTSLVSALAHQLGAQVETARGAQGTRVSITHAIRPAMAA